MTTPNIGWKYYYDYFKGLDYRGGKPGFVGGKDVKKRNDALTKEIILQDYEETRKEVFPQLGEHGFELTTCYPGLIIGSGYQHEVGVEEEFKLGFFFDHTTGLPIIPGSSIKGVIRNVFQRSPSYIAGLISGPDLGERPSDVQIAQLALEIFGPPQGEAEVEGQSLQGQDRFYDAIPKADISFAAQLLGKDNLTPHRSPFTDPVPLLFLKIMPGVTFQFDFALQDARILPAFTADKKENLFKTILLDMGLGAKTNVGYGQFLEPDKWKKIYGEEAGIEEEPENLEVPKRLIRKEPLSPFGTTALYGKIIPSTEKDIERNKPRKGVEFFTSPDLQLNNKRSKLLNKYEEGDWVSVTVRYDDKRKQVSEIIEPIKLIEKS